MEIKKTTNLETNLHGLAKFANYSVRVLAFTAAGEGVRSNSVHCTTEEDGKLSEISGHSYAFSSKDSNKCGKSQPYPFHCKIIFCCFDGCQ